MSNPRVDIVIVVPHPVRATVFEAAQRSLSALIQHTRQAGYVVAISEHYGAGVSCNRNSGVAIALQHKAKWIFFVDDDMVLPPDTILRLLARNVNVVSGLYVKRQQPFVPIAYNIEDGDFIPIADPPDDTLVQVDAVGGGCLLVDTTVFSQLPKPYFAVPPHGTYVMSEDIYFCQQLTSRGIKVHLDTGATCGHVGDYIYTVENCLADRDEHSAEVIGG